MRTPVLGRPLIVGVLLALCFGAIPAQGAFLATETSTATRMANNLYMYTYTVMVMSTSTVSASELDLAVIGSIDPNSITLPTNFTFFTFYTPGDPVISFTAADTGDPFVGISPGMSATFSYTSIFAPVTSTYQMTGLDPSFSLDYISGTALTPGATVPEPSSLFLTGIGACGLLGGLARSRRLQVARVG